MNLHKELGTRFNFSAIFHPQTDGQFEITIQILEDVLKVVELDRSGSEESMLPLIEFAYNNSYQANVDMASYTALCGIKCKSPFY